MGFKIFLLIPYTAQSKEKSKYKSKENQKTNPCKDSEKNL